MYNDAQALRHVPDFRPQHFAAKSKTDARSWRKTKGEPVMYGKGGVAGPVVATTTTVGALTLPNTGGNMLISLALSVASGLVVWGVLYAKSTR
jgi:hypothetical protein